MKPPALTKVHSGPATRRPEGPAATGIRRTTIGGIRALLRFGDWLGLCAGEGWGWRPQEHLDSACPPLLRWRSLEPTALTAAKRSVATAVVVLFALNLLLNYVFLLPGEYRYRDTIEAGYASMARFFSQHPDPFGWVPTQYGGLPAHLWYLPVIPYTGALAMRVLGFLEPYHAYRILAVTLASLGPATLWIFVWYFTRSRKWAWFAALLYTFCAFGYGVFPAVNFDRGLNTIPWRIQVLIKYGEGPHNAGLMLLPLALIALWRAGIEWTFPRMFLAAAALAAVCLTNWVAALSLAWCCLMMLGAWGGFSGDRRRFALSLLATAGLAWLLASFWLTPRFIQTTLFNWPVDSINFKPSPYRGAFLAALFWLPLILRWALRKADRFLCWVAMCFGGLFVVVASHYWFAADAIPESRRYLIEAEFFAMVLLAAVLARLDLSGVAWRQRAALLGMGVAMGLGAWQAGSYALRTWPRHQPLGREDTPEWRVAAKLNELAPQGRVLVSGGTRFRLNAWFDLPQLGGTFESGLRNRIAQWILYQFQTGMNSPPERRVADAELLLRGQGVEYVAVHGPSSAEHYRDIKTPFAFKERWQVVYEDGQDLIYRVPFNGLAHVVRPDELPSVRPNDQYVGQSEAWVKGFDDPARPKLQLRWLGPSDIEVTGAVPEGMWVSVIVTYDGGWRAEQDGRALPVERDPLDHLLLKPAASASTTLRLTYHPALEHQAMAALSGAVWLGCLVWLWRCVTSSRLRRARSASD